MRASINKYREKLSPRQNNFPTPLDIDTEAYGDLGH